MKLFKSKNRDLVDYLNLEIVNLTNKLEKEKHCYARETRELSTLCIDSSNSINILANNVLKGERTLDVWNFKKVATGICNSVYEVLCEICKPYDDFTVNIMLDDITAKGKKRKADVFSYFYLLSLTLPL